MLTLNLPGKCIYSDFENIIVKFQKKEMSLDEMEACEQFKEKKRVYYISDIIATSRILSIMRVFNIVPAILVVLIILLPYGEILLTSNINLDRIIKILWFVLYVTEIIIIIIRIKSKVGTFLINLHPDYKDVSFRSILYLYYFKK